MTEVEGSLLLNVDKGTPIVRPRGLYSSTETYVYDHEFRDMVEFRASDSGGMIKSYYFLVRSRWDKLKGVAPVPGDASSSRKWEQSSDFKFITADSIVADMIQAGAITADKILAGAITSEKLSSDFIFTKQIKIGPDATHINFSVDAKGFMTSKGATIEGAITANSGKIGMFSIGEAGSYNGWLLSGLTMGLSGAQLFFTDSSRNVYIGSHPGESSSGQPYLGYFDLKSGGSKHNRSAAILAKSSGYFSMAITANGKNKLDGGLSFGKPVAISSEWTYNTLHSCYYFDGSNTYTLPIPDAEEIDERTSEAMFNAVFISGGVNGGYIKYVRDKTEKEYRLLADEGAVFIYGSTGWNVYGGRR